jgi:hypothetical protein
VKAAHWGRQRLDVRGQRIVKAARWRANTFVYSRQGDSRSQDSHPGRVRSPFALEATVRSGQISLGLIRIKRRSKPTEAGMFRSKINNSHRG